MLNRTQLMYEAEIELVQNMLPANMYVLPNFIVRDKNGNTMRLNVERFKEDYAQETQRVIDAMESLVNCFDCEECDNCTGCTNCFACRCCNNCHNCNVCSGCTNCSKCDSCIGCSGCNDCYMCLGIDNSETVIHIKGKSNEV